MEGKHIIALIAVIAVVGSQMTSETGSCQSEEDCFNKNNVVITLVIQAISKLDEVTSTLGEMKTKQDKTDDTLGNMKTDVRNMKTEMENMKAEIGNVKKAVHNSKIEVKNEIAEIKIQVADVKSEVTSSKSELKEGHSSIVSSLTSSKTELKDGHSSIVSSLTNLQEKCQPPECKNTTCPKTECGTTTSPKTIPLDCEDLFSDNSPTLPDGVYEIQPPNSSASFQVYCEMSTGGWTVIQARRGDRSINFNRNWEDYTNGFGNMATDFWLGNQKMYLLTRQGGYRLRVDLVYTNNTSAYAEYSTFSVGPVSEMYRLTVTGYYKGSTAENGLNDGSTWGDHNGMSFSTSDRDQERSSHKCASKYGAGWWYNNCYRANLNRAYTDSGGLKWDYGSHNIKLSVMKIKHN